MSTDMTWMQMMEAEGAFDYTEGDYLGAGYGETQLADATEADILANIQKQKARRKKREELRLLCGERMVAPATQRWNPELKEYEYLSLIDADKGITESWRRFRPMSKATVRSMFWRVMDDE